MLMPFAAKQMFRGGGENALIFPNGFVDAINGIGDGDGAASFCITATVSFAALATAMQTNQPATVALETGTFTQAMSAFQVHTPVMLVLSITAPDTETVVSTVQCVLSEHLTNGGVSSLVGTCIVHTDMQALGSPISLPFAIAYDIGLLSDNLVMQWRPERTPLVMQVGLGEPIGNDVEIDGHVVSDLKANSGFQSSSVHYPIYGSATVEQSQALLAMVRNYVLIGGLVIIYIYLGNNDGYTLQMQIQNATSDTVVSVISRTVYGGNMELRLVPLDNATVLMLGST